MIEIVAENEGIVAGLARLMARFCARQGPCISVGRGNLPLQQSVTKPLTVIESSFTSK